MKTVFPIVLFMILLPIVGLLGYIFGYTHATRLEGDVWISQFVPMELTAAEHIRNNRIDKALTLLELNSLFYSRTLAFPKKSIFPTQKEFLSFFANNDVVKETSIRSSEALALSKQYTSSHPESLDKLKK